MAHGNGHRARLTTGAGRVLELVRTGRADTRLALTEESGLARATVSDRVDMLVRAGLLLQDGSAASTGGRRAASYAFNADAGVVLVADLGASAARFAACDLSARVLADERHPLDLAAGPDPTLELVRARLAAVLEASGRAPEDVVAITMGVPGPVEVGTGRVVAPPIMPGWDGLDVPSALHLPYEAPVLLDNDVNLMALGEHRSVLADEQHLLVVKVGTGVGSGIIANGMVHRGAQGAAGDIGHIRGHGRDELCRCGMRGCVEASAGGWALARDLRALGRDVRDSADAVALVAARDPDALRLLSEAGSVLGTAIADAVSFFNPSTVVLGGDLAHAHELLLGRVREVVYAASLPLATRSLRIDLSELGERSGVIGGAHRAIEHRLAPAAIDRELEARLSAPAPVAAWPSVTARRAL